MAYPRFTGEVDPERTTQAGRVLAKAYADGNRNIGKAEIGWGMQTCNDLDASHKKSFNYSRMLRVAILQRDAVFSRSAQRARKILRGFQLQFAEDRGAVHSEKFGHGADGAMSIQCVLDEPALNFGHDFLKGFARGGFE
jgi:hypothetical protein